MFSIIQLFVSSIERLCFAIKSCGHIFPDMEELVVDHLENDTNDVDEEQITKQDYACVKVIKRFYLNVDTGKDTDRNVLNEKDQIKDQLSEESWFLVHE